MIAPNETELNGWHVGDRIYLQDGTPGTIFRIDDDFYPIMVELDDKSHRYFDVYGKEGNNFITLKEPNMKSRSINLCGGSNYVSESTVCGDIPDKPVAVKFDNNKNRLDLLPIEALESIGRVFTFGSKKYGDRNWENGMDYSRLFGALLRHVFAFWRGEDLDPESGESHLAHAGCCITMLLTQTIRKSGTDDRSK